VATLAYASRKLHGDDSASKSCYDAVNHYIELAMEAVDNDEVQSADRGMNPFLWELFEDAQTAQVEQDRAQSMEMYKKLQSQGDLEATEVMGEAYFFGDPTAGIEQDPVMARQMFEQAARHESPGALHNLAMMHLKGMGWDEAQPAEPEGQFDAQFTADAEVLPDGSILGNMQDGSLPQGTTSGANNEPMAGATSGAGDGMQF